MPVDAWASVRRVLVACPGNEALLAAAVPALCSLRQALPGAEISLWTPTCNTKIADRLPGINELLLSPVAWTGTLMPLINAIRNRAFDAAIILTGPKESPYPAAYICYLAGIPIRIAQSREFGGSILSQWIKPLEEVVATEEHFAHLLEAAGLRRSGDALSNEPVTESTRATAISTVSGEKQ